MLYAAVLSKIATRTMGNDSRKDERLRSRGRPYVHVYTPRAIAHGWLINVSEGGIGIASLEKSVLPVGSRAEINLAGLEEENESTLFYGRVRHSSGYRHGIEFEKENPYTPAANSQAQD